MCKSDDDDDDDTATHKTNIYVDYDDTGGDGDDSNGKKGKLYGCYMYYKNRVNCNHLKINSENTCATHRVNTKSRHYRKRPY
jgi:hypothetical protein